MKIWNFNLAEAHHILDLTKNYGDFWEFDLANCQFVEDFELCDKNYKLFKKINNLYRVAVYGNQKMKTLTKKAVRLALKGDLSDVLRLYGFKNAVYVGNQLFVDCDFDIGVLADIEITKLVKFNDLYREICQKIGIKSADFKTVLRAMRDAKRIIIKRELQILFLKGNLSNITTCYGKSWESVGNCDELSAFCDAEVFDNNHGFGLRLSYGYSKKWNLLEYWGLSND